MQKNYLEGLKLQLENCNDGDFSELVEDDGEWACQKVELRTLFDK